MIAEWMDWRNRFGTRELVEELQFQDLQVNLLMLHRQRLLDVVLSEAQCLDMIRHDPSLLTLFTKAAANIWLQLSDKALLHVMFSLPARRVRQDDTETWTVVSCTCNAVAYGSWPSPPPAPYTLRVCSCNACIRLFTPLTPTRYSSPICTVPDHMPV